MKLFQVFDDSENTYYVEAANPKQAVRFVAETFQTRIQDWCELTFVPVNTTIHVAYERKTYTTAVA